MTDEINDIVFYKIIDFIELKIYGKNMKSIQPKIRC
jgi:hypothetical protein